jgi:Fe-S cluster biosynthesis and repair protein YggX
LSSTIFARLPADAEESPAGRDLRANQPYMPVRNGWLRAPESNRRAGQSPQSNTIETGVKELKTAMAHTVFCVRNKKEMEGLDEPPFDSEFGQKIFKNVSKAAWAEWVDRQRMLLNEYRLQPWTPQAQQFLVEQMQEFFFGEGLALPKEFVPPAH